jgi:ribosomal protein L17
MIDNGLKWGNMKMKKLSGNFNTTLSSVGTVLLAVSLSIGSFIIATILTVIPPHALHLWLSGLMLSIVTISYFLPQFLIGALSLPKEKAQKKASAKASVADTITHQEIVSTIKWLKEYRDHLEKKSAKSTTTSTKNTQTLFDETNQHCAVIVTTDVYNPKSYIIPTNQSENKSMYQLLSEQDSITKTSGFLQDKGFQPKILKAVNISHYPTMPGIPTSQANHPIQFPSNFFTLN